jgi:hypothetical protein
LKTFEGYDEDWDGEGAAKPKKGAIGGAIALLQKLQPWHPHPLATLDTEGNAVVEFRDDDTKLFGKVRFLSANSVEMFALVGDAEPAFIEGIMDTPVITKFLSDQFQITLQS